jgi:pyruvate,orthophosphate dikinase
MVYGNRSRQSGSGVAFTHNPRWAGDTLRLWGDFTIGNQGEDVVAGLVSTLPISITQQEIELRDTDIILETHFPEIYNTLHDWAVELTENRGWSPQEMEFTFEGPAADQLYLLQTRDMSFRARKKVLTFVTGDIRKEHYLGNGIGVSGGAMSGRIIFNLDEIDRWREKEPETDLILLRNDTVPDDIREINAADGLLTARGGMTSHAAVVAHRLNKTCVVGCDTLVCNEEQKECRFGEKRLTSGDFISINGREGRVYKDRIRIQEESQPENPMERITGGKTQP